MFLASDPFVVALFKHSFMGYALITGLMIGFIAPLIGSFVVIRRLSFITDTLSHFSLAGLSIGLFLINILRLKVIEKVIDGRYTLDRKFIFLYLYKLKKEENEDTMNLNQKTLPTCVNLLLDSLHMHLQTFHFFLF